MNDLFSVQIERGCVLLTEKCGDDWFSRIDLERLNMGHSPDHLVGQLFGNSYYYGLCTLYGITPVSSSWPKWAVPLEWRQDHGFEVSPFKLNGVFWNEYQAKSFLEQEWRVVLNTLRSSHI